VALRGGSVLLGVALVFLLAEFGDKTMLATVTLATTQSTVATWLGAGAGMTATSGIAIALTAWAGTHLPERPVRLAAAGAFLLFSVLLLVDGLRG
jgi:Ca2+/H+ antiporter, TMEM165/GDT1 family